MLQNQITQRTPKRFPTTTPRFKTKHLKYYTKQRSIQRQRPFKSLVRQKIKVKRVDKCILSWKKRYIKVFVRYFFTYFIYPHCVFALHCCFELFVVANLRQNARFTHSSHRS